MKGATPEGPRMSIKATATASAAPRAKAGQLPTSISNALRQRDGMYCPARPRNKTMQTGVEARVTAPGTARRLNMSKATSKLEARKNTHPAHTAWNMRMRAIQRQAVEFRSLINSCQELRLHSR